MLLKSSVLTNPAQDRRHSGLECFWVDLHPIRLSRAAAASSAVPVVLSPITTTAASCDYQQPPRPRACAELPKPPRPAARALNRLQELQSRQWRGRPIFPSGGRRLFIVAPLIGAALASVCYGVIRISEPVIPARIAEAAFRVNSSNVHDRTHRITAGYNGF